MVVRHGSPQVFCRFVSKDRQERDNCVQSVDDVHTVMQSAFHFDPDRGRPEVAGAKCISVFEIQGLKHADLIALSETHLGKEIVFHVFLEVENVLEIVGDYLNYDNTPERHVNIERLESLGSKKDRNTFRDRLARASKVYEETMVIPAVRESTQ